MADRTWLVTGCSRGFGRALAEVLLERGERVAATARDPATLDGLVARGGERALALALDVTDPASVARAVAVARERFGRVDVLVNNAGGGHFGTIEDAPIEHARAMMELNFFGALAMIKAVLPEMVERRAGQIVNVGSVAGQIGFPTVGYYAASKFALTGLSESLAAEMAPLGIRVTLAELGPFATGFAGAMTVVPPSSHYDPLAMATEAGNAHWRGGEDPHLGAQALLDALDEPKPPRRLVIGNQGLDVVALHDARRRAESERWRSLGALAETVEHAAP